MKRRAVLDLIEGGENINCEFKLKFSSAEKIAKEIIAFANTSGGFILFGIDDSKKIVGVESEKQETELILQSAREYCEPPVEVEIEYIELDGCEIVIAGIPESQHKPHRLQDYKPSLDTASAQVYIRVNDKSVLASKEMVRLMKNETAGKGLIKYSIGELEKKVFEILEQQETITVKELCSKANLSERRASRTLIKMVRAGLLFIHTKENGDDYFSARSV